MWRVQGVRTKITCSWKFSILAGRGVTRPPLATARQIAQNSTSGTRARAAAVEGSTGRDYDSVLLSVTATPAIMNKKSPRRQQILEALAHMLEAAPGERITTAGLARAVGVSEAALYRHFPSKSKMFEGLIEFIEETVFSRITLILAEEQSAYARCDKILSLLLAFAERNPGISRLLTGDVLAGETERLRQRMAQFFDRLETQLRQILREAELREEMRTTIPVAMAANLLMATVEGRVCQFVRSEFRRRPTEHWQEQWPVLIEGFFKPVALAHNQVS